jgi:hypothetical protein
MADAAPHLVQNLAEVSENSTAALSFIEKCWEYLGDSVGEILDWTYSQLPSDPAQGIQTIKSLAHHFPRLFAQDGQKYIAPLLNGLVDHCDEDLILIIFYILPEVPPDDVARICEVITGRVLDAFSSVMNDGTIYDFQDFSMKVFEAATPSVNPDFFRALAERILETVNDSHDVYLEVLALFLKKGYFDDRSQICESIFDELQGQPCPRLFLVLEGVADLVPPELLGALELPNAPLQVAHLEFLKTYLKLNPDGFAQLVTIEWIHDMLGHESDSVVKAALQLVNEMIEGLEEVAADVMNWVMEILFHKLSAFDIWDAICVIRNIESRFGIDPGFETYVGPDCRALQTFRVLFANRNVSRDVMTSATLNLVAVTRGQQNA